LTINKLFVIINADKEDKMALMMYLKDLQVRGDRVLVKQLKFEEKVGTFYVPESVRTRKEKRRADAWKAEVITLGDKIYFRDGEWTFKKGDTIYCAPVSLDCPSFEGEDGAKYMIITQEDCLAVEEK
jgi:co-chaperonin GroES (HSP10)